MFVIYDSDMARVLVEESPRRYRGCCPVHIRKPMLFISDLVLLAVVIAVSGRSSSARRTGSDLSTRMRGMSALLCKRFCMHS